MFQYFSICGAGAANHSCAPVDTTGPARLRPTWNGGDSSPTDLAARIRTRLGEDKDLVAVVSFGGSQSNAILRELFRNATLTAVHSTEDAFICTYAYIYMHTST